MTNVTDRRDGVSEGLAMKRPCRVATTAAITLSGEQTIDGVAVVENDRVLVKDQSDATANGIYRVSTGAWSRARDFDGNRDFVTGTRCFVTHGTTNAGNEYSVSVSTDPVVIGTTTIVFTALQLVTVDRLTGTSTSSHTIGTGSKAFTTQSGKAWQVGQYVIASEVGTPSNYMIGQVSAYSGSTLTISVASGDTSGAGTIANWTITVSGPRGASGAGYAATSTTSLAIGTGSKAFTTQAGLAYTAGARVRAASAANAANWMEGVVASYSGTTLTVTVDSFGGTGTLADWNINLAGERGVAPAFQFLFETATTDSDKDAGEFWLNHATPANATVAYFDNVEKGGNSVTAWLDAMDDVGASALRGHLFIYDPALPAVNYMFSVSGSVVDGTGYRKVTIAYVAGAGSFTAGNAVAALFIPAGATGATGATGASVAIPFTFEDDTDDSDKDAGEFWLNHATPANATVAYFDNADRNGATQTGWLDAMDDGGDASLRGYLVVSEVATPATRYVLAVTGSVVDGTGYRKVTIAYVSGAGSFTNGNEIAAFFVPRGPAGTGDVSATSDFGTDNRLIRSDGVNKNLQASGISVDDSDNVSGVGTLATTGNITENGNRVAAIADPNADRVLIWDDSANGYVGATLEGNIAIVGTALRAIETFSIALSDETTAITTGTNKATYSLPYAFTLYNPAGGLPVYATLNTASSSGTPTVDINEAGVSILSTKLTIDANEKTSATAATPAVVSDTAIAANAEIGFDIDVAGTGAKGLKVTFMGYRT